MLKDISYSELKQDGHAYEIMLLRDQYGNTFTAIAKEYERSIARITQLYNKIKCKQARLYINHISVVLGHSNTAQIGKIYADAYMWYQDRSYACAYLEKEYTDILKEYRNGEPGMPAQFIKDMPPFKPKLSKKTIARVIEMREVEKASFVAIAKDLRMTQAKARHIYEMFYHQKVLKFIMDLQEDAKNESDKYAVWRYYFRTNITSKKRFDMLMKGKAPAGGEPDKI